VADGMPVLAAGAGTWPDEWSPVGGRAGGARSCAWGPPAHRGRPDAGL